jgi:NTP pyrophosphatase (non-canonical NTP hydrolase)
MNKKQTIDNFRIIKNYNGFFYIQVLKEQFKVKENTIFDRRFRGKEAFEIIPTTKEWEYLTQKIHSEVGAYMSKISFKTYDYANKHIHKILTKDDIEIFEPKPIQEMNIKKFEELQPLVIQWAKEKGIFEEGNPLAQCEKTMEEVEELMMALQAQNLKIDAFKNFKGKEVNTQEEIKDALGDILVTIIIQAQMQVLDLMDCLQSAYDVISKRTGKMVEGQFVKDE